MILLLTKSSLLFHPFFFYLVLMACYCKNMVLRNDRNSSHQKVLNGNNEGTNSQFADPVMHFIDALIELEEEMERYANYVIPYSWTTFHLLADGSMLAFKDVNEEYPLTDKMKNNNKAEETTSNDAKNNNASIIVHIIRQFSPTNFWEPESKRFQAEENYRKVIASLTDEQIEILIQNKSRWPEFQRKRKIMRYEDKIVIISQALSKLRKSQARGS